MNGRLSFDVTWTTVIPNSSFFVISTCGGEAASVRTGFSESGTTIKNRTATNLQRRNTDNGPFPIVAAAMVAPFAPGLGGHDHESVIAATSVILALLSVV